MSIYTWEQLADYIQYLYKKLTRIEECAWGNMETDLYKMLGGLNLLPHETPPEIKPRYYGAKHYEIGFYFPRHGVDCIYDFGPKWVRKA